MASDLSDSALDLGAALLRTPEGKSLSHSELLRRASESTRIPSRMVSAYFLGAVKDVKDFSWYPSMHHAQPAIAIELRGDMVDEEILFRFQQGCHTVGLLTRFEPTACTEDETPDRIKIMVVRNPADNGDDKTSSALLALHHMKETLPESSRKNIKNKSLQLQIDEVWREHNITRTVLQ